MLREIKSEYIHYFMDEFGRIQGEGKEWYDNGVLRYHGYYVDSKLHGEYKRWNIHKRLISHIYYVNDKMVHDFLLNPISDEEKMLLVLKHGAPMLPKHSF